ncbi:MAG TPA: protein TolR [Alphaproteobacteria bacterium]
MALAPIEQGSGDGGTHGWRPMSEINVTPMVDVMLVLLVIFMVAAPLMTAGVPVELPKTQAAKVSQPKRPIIVTIDRTGRTFLHDEEVDPANLRGRLDALRADDSDQVIYVRGDQAAAYGRVLEVMGLINAAGFSKVSLISHALDGARP